MKLELKHIAPYLTHRLEVLVFGTVCEVEGVDLHRKNTLIAERVNYSLDDTKPILYPFEDYIHFNEVIDEMSDFQMTMIDDNPDLVKKLSYDVIEKMLKNNIDIFGLIHAGLAIDINSLK